MGLWKDGVYYSDEEMQAIYNASPEGHYQNQINRRDKLYSSDTGGTKLPARRNPIPVISHEELMQGRQRLNNAPSSIWNDPMVQLGVGGGTSM